MTDTDSQTTRTELDAIIEALHRDKRKRVRKLLRGMHPGKVASLLEALDGAERLALWQHIDDDREEQVLKHLTPLLGAQLRREPDTSDLTDEDEEGEGAATQIARVRDALEAGKFKRVGKAFRQMHPAKAAGLLEALPPAERSTVWEMLDAERAGKILVHLHDEVRARLALEMDEDELVAAARKLDLDDLVDLIQALPSDSGRQLLQAMDVRKRQQLLSMLSYPEDSAGGLMNTDHISVRADVRVGSVLRYLRLLEDLPDHTDKVMVVDRKNRYQGVLRLSRLVTSAPELAVSEVMDSDFQPLDVMLPSHDVARRFEDLDILSAAVVDEDGLLLGRITVDDVMDLIREDSERTMMNMAGLDDEADMFAPVLTSSRRRAVWLGINLVTAFLAAWVIGLFQGTLEQLVALAVLMPIVASMGGIAGSQTLTLVVRGMALGQVEGGNARLLLGKEIGIACLNGVLWALVVAALAVAWFGSWQLGAVIAAAILLNLLCAAVSGLLIPLLLRRVGVDPALAGSVILTTVTDVVGFLAFLGLATLFLL
ncbi:magnesium transporter [Halopseudomonas aestusnigri]|jgi:magnesium transporter|uniref:magnesium transporter n=1 Tax=Halopseudomonas TaxID=2901189 RepID=UPI000C8A9407|nr:MULTISPECIES: magnesium transporter [Halopseudomonas]MAK75258.1 magnesium transporter [Pseudomonadales bacterium]MEE2798877.1 magnesium transporter [Pseudomonadota bacterium]MCC4259697.1 magnesium transporter [Halopseudomonas aestusnigri]MDL2199764.1 magnesium transporter [Halopseudomonas aestusnigri]UGV31227.1 magnesium transporter [Halopseudomonas aestusnigri]|tara:strand:- start:15786 stop:17408 length:1623 start_codon:yes stop_codon:yes gene_type:complete